MTKRFISIAYLAMTLSLLIIYANFEKLFIKLTEEDFLIEWATSISYLLAGCIFWTKFIRQFANIRWNAWFYLFLATGCIIVGGEEISWGQRLFGLATPELLAEYNYQNEISLHNIGEWQKDWQNKIYMFAIFIYVIVLPTLYNFTATAKRLCHSVNLVIPPRDIVLPFLCSVAFPVFTKLNLWLDMGFTLSTDYVLEVTELFSGLLFLHFSLLTIRSEFSAGSLQTRI